MRILYTMFVANDPEKHDLCWSEHGNGWMLENAHEGFLRWSESFEAGMKELSEISGTKVEDFAVEENPYYEGP